MKRLPILILSLALAGGTLFAQNTRDILLQHQELIAGTDYVGPTEPLKLTPAPATSATMPATAPATPGAWRTTT